MNKEPTEEQIKEAACKILDALSDFTYGDGIKMLDTIKAFLITTCIQEAVEETVKEMQKEVIKEEIKSQGRNN